MGLGVVEGWEVVGKTVSMGKLSVSRMRFWESRVHFGLVFCFFSLQFKIWESDPGIK